MEHAEPSEHNLESHEDLVLHFIGNEEEFYEDQDNAVLEINKESNNKNNKVGRKKLSGGLVEETFFTLTHALSTFSDEITYLLTGKGFNYVLTRKDNNDTIDHRFSLNRHLGGHHLLLDVSAFSHKE